MKADKIILKKEKKYLRRDALRVDDFLKHMDHVEELAMNIANNDDWFIHAQHVLLLFCTLEEIKLACCSHYLCHEMVEVLSATAIIYFLKTSLQNEIMSSRIFVIA